MSFEPVSTQRPIEKIAAFQPVSKFVYPFEMGKKKGAEITVQYGVYIDPQENKGIPTVYVNAFNGRKVEKPTGRIPSKKFEKELEKLIHGHTMNFFEGQEPENTTKNTDSMYKLIVRSNDQEALESIEKKVWNLKRKGQKIYDKKIRYAGEFTSYVKKWNKKRKWLRALGVIGTGLAVTGIAFGINYYLGDKIEQLIGSAKESIYQWIENNAPPAIHTAVNNVSEAINYVDEILTKGSEALGLSAQVDGYGQDVENAGQDLIDGATDPGITDVNTSVDQNDNGILDSQEDFDTTAEQIAEDVDNGVLTGQLSKAIHDVYRLKEMNFLKGYDLKTLGENIQTASEGIDEAVGAMITAGQMLYNPATQTGILVDLDNDLKAINADITQVNTYFEDFKGIVANALKVGGKLAAYTLVMKYAGLVALPIYCTVQAVRWGKRAKKAKDAITSADRMPLELPYAKADIVFQAVPDNYAQVA